MKTAILIVYGIEEFSGYMKSSLESTKQYKVTTTQNPKEAIRFTRDQSFQLAIIDLDLPIGDLVSSLEANDPAVPIIGIVGADNLIEVEPMSDRFHRILTKPVILTDIPVVAAQVLFPQDSEAEESASDSHTDEPEVRFDPSVPPWLTDQNIAAGYLDVLKDDSDAIACRLYVGDQAYAVSGEIPTLVSGWVDTYVNRSIANQEEATLMVKFVRLDELNTEFTTFSRIVVSNFALYTMFNGYTDFAIARRQTDHIASSLAKKNPAAYFQDIA